MNCPSFLIKKKKKKLASVFRGPHFFQQEPDDSRKAIVELQCCQNYTKNNKNILKKIKMITSDREAHQCVVAYVLHTIAFLSTSEENLASQTYPGQSKMKATKKVLPNHFINSIIKLNEKDGKETFDR